VIAFVESCVSDCACVNSYQAHTLSPRDTSILSNLGLARYNAGYLDGAIAAYEQTLRLQPDLVNPTVMLSQVCDPACRSVVRSSRACFCRRIRDSPYSCIDVVVVMKGV
jgi:hypothetical protein